MLPTGKKYEMQFLSSASPASDTCHMLDMRQVNICFNFYLWENSDILKFLIVSLQRLMNDFSF